MPPAPDTDYVIIEARTFGAGRVLVSFTTATRQRMSIMVPFARTTADQLDPIIRHTIANVARPTKPLSPNLKGA